VARLARRSSVVMAVKDRDRSGRRGSSGSAPGERSSELPRARHASAARLFRSGLGL